MTTAPSAPSAPDVLALPSVSGLPSNSTDAKAFGHGVVNQQIALLFMMRLLFPIWALVLRSGPPTFYLAGLWFLALFHLLPLSFVLLLYHFHHFRLLDRKPLLPRVRDGLVFPRRSSRAITVAVALGCALAAGIVWVAHLPPFGKDASQALVANLLSTGRGKATLLTLLVLLPFLEEGFFRGCVFPYLRAKTGAFAACLLVALLCGLCLLPQFPGYWYWVGVPLLIALTAMHLVLTVERHVFDSVTPPLITHAVCNLVLAVLVVLV